MKKKGLSPLLSIWKKIHSNIFIFSAVIFLALVAIFTRYYQLDTVPAPWHIDEAGMAYDAYSLAFWRVERHMMHLPVYLPNYGDGQSALYAYLTAIFVRIFNDITPLIARLPAAFFSMAAIAFSALFVKKMYGKRWAILTAFLATIFPYYIMQGRYGLDCNIFLSTSIIASYFTLIAILSKKHMHFVLAGVTWAITLYAYALSWIIVPFFLLILFSYLFYVKQITIKHLFSFGLPLFVLGLPLIIFCIIEVFDLMPVYSRFYYIPRLTNNRIGTFRFFNLSSFIKLPKLLFWVQDGEAYLHYPTFYWISVPFSLIGMYFSAREILKKLRQKKFSAYSLIIFYFLANLFSISINSVYSNDTHHINSIFGPMAFFIVIGIYTTYRWIKKWRNSSFANILLANLLVLYSAAFLRFTYQYFVIFPQIPTYAKTFMYSPTPKTAMDKLEEYGRDNQIEDIIAQRDIWIDIPRYTLYYLGEKTPPTEMNLTEDILNEVRFGRVYFSFMPGRNTTYCGGQPFCREDISDQDIYIVNVTEREYLDRLKELGLSEIYRDDAFTILLKPDSFYNIEN
jgi:hypothetical protein